jgi:hypothetical protein
MDYLNSYKLINQGSKRERNTIQRVSVDTHKTMNFAISNNGSNNRYDINYTVTNTTAK